MSGRRHQDRSRVASRGTKLLAALMVVVLGLGVAVPVRSVPVAGGELAEARERADQAVAELAAADAALVEIDDGIATAERAVAEAQRTMDSLRGQVQELAVRRYMQLDTVPVIPDGSPSDLENARVMVLIVAGKRFDALERYGIERSRMQALQAELVQSRKAQEARRGELAERRVAVEAELVRLEELERQQRLERAAAERAAAEREAAERAGASSTSGLATTTTGGGGESTTTTGPPTTVSPTTGPPTTGPPTTGPPTTGPPTTGPPTGGWLCPVQGARSFVDSWLAPRPGGRAHQGVDIMSPRGTPVVLPVGGQTSFYTGGIGGLTFSLNGDDGNYYYGAHLDRYAGLGDGWYAAGTVVGYVGDTGDARGTGTHLHFEIHLGGYGNAVNPYPTTRANC